MLVLLWSHICWCKNILLYKTRAMHACLHAALMWVQVLLLTPSPVCTLHTLTENKWCNHSACMRLRSPSRMRSLWFTNTSCNEKS